MSDAVTDFSAAEARVAEVERQANAAADAENSFFGRLSGTSRERQREYDRALVAAMLELMQTCQSAIRTQEARLSRIEQQAGALLALSERLHELQEQFARGCENAQVSREGVEGVQVQQRQAREELQNELRERIQHIVDEQRVALRQLALQGSEEAVLADRARRGTEARLEQLEERVQQLAPDRSKQ